ncbi:hypothetical protein [uncultured Methanobrevibacter sp.]|uniref:hypothetical protein n=1 Tax=uncultured Methanobrevibacter sp. TaxID=253161 RepID=UPI0025D5ECB8|nr:hypothetical protein [uncultured Methanobrevibacter sp.]
MNSNIKKTSFNFDADLLKELKRIAFENETTQTEIIHQFLFDAVERNKQNNSELIVIEDDLIDKLALMSDVKKQGINELVNDYISRGLSADGISKFHREKITTDDIIGMIEDDGEDWDIDKEVYG